MIEIIKTLIERVLSWPVAVLILGIIFRHEMAAFWSRINHLTFTHGATRVEANAGLASVQNVKVEASEAITGGLRAPTSSVPDAIQSARQAALDFGKNLEAVQVREEDIRQHLASLAFSDNNPETIQVLVRNLAFAQWIAHSERTYRLIFGSQIAALKYLHENGARPEREIEGFFDAASIAAPEFYKNYTFEMWIGFLLAQQLVLRNYDAGTFEITRGGRGFLIWMTMEAASDAKRG